MVNKKMIAGKGSTKIKLIALVLVVAIGAAGIMFYGEDMIGYASRLLLFTNEDGEPGGGQGSMSAFLAAYDKDGNLIRKGGISQSGFYVGGVELTRIGFSFSISFVGVGIDWNTLQLTSEELTAFPNEQDPIDIMSLRDANSTGISAYMFSIYDVDYGPTGMSYYLQDLLGTSVAVGDDGTEVYLLQLVFEIEYSVETTNGTTLTSGAQVVGTWELTKPNIAEPYFDITINTGETDVDNRDLSDVIQAMIDKEEPETTNNNSMVDKDLAPDVRILPISNPQLAS